MIYGNSFEDLVTISAKTRMNDLSNIEKDLNLADELIDKNENLNLVYPTKIYKFSKDLFDKASYILNLDEENPIKTGLINSKALHSQYLAKWAQEFAKIYIQDNIIITPKEILESLNKIKVDNEIVFQNQTVLDSYNSLSGELNNLINNELLVGKDTLMECYDKQYKLIQSILNEYSDYNLGEIEKAQLESLILQLDNLSEKYIKVLSNYILEDTITNDSIKDSINTTIDKYNKLETKIDTITFLIQKSKDIYNKDMQTVNQSRNYINKLRILKLNQISNLYIDNVVEEIKTEISKIELKYDKDLETKTNGPITVTINHGNKTKVVNNEGKDYHTFYDNGEFKFLLSIKKEQYYVDVKVDNIVKIVIENSFIKNIQKNTEVDSLKKFLNNVTTVIHNGRILNSSTDILSTGDIVKTGDNKEYTVVIYGDINSDGNVNAKDLIRYRKYLVNSIKLSEAQILAIDINMDKKSNIKDLIQVRKILLQ